VDLFVGFVENIIMVLRLSYIFDLKKQDGNNNTKTHVPTANTVPTSNAQTAQTTTTTVPLGKLNI
jgi:hypothetical protein